MKFKMFPKKYETKDVGLEKLLEDV